MSEFPALRDSLVRAASRRRRRRRIASAAAPVLAVGVAAVAFVSVSPAPDDERTVEPARDAYERAYEVLRRPRTVEDVLPRSPRAGASLVPKGALEGRSRLVGRDGDARIYAVPARAEGEPWICMLRYPGGVGCAPVSKPVLVRSGTTYTFLVPDGVRDLHLSTRTGRYAPRGQRNLAVIEAKGPPAAVVWTDATGTRHVDRRARTETRPLSAGCPPLEPKPRDALDRAMRAALLAVESTYPEATSARATSAADATAGFTGCGAEADSRSVVVGLRLTPRDAGRRHADGPPEGLLVLGSVDGEMVVYRVLR